MFCIDAEYVLVFLCSVFLLVCTVAERHIANIKKLVAISAIHSFVFITSMVLCFLLNAKLARWNENVMVRLPNG